MGIPTDPPHLRKATGDHHCGSCKMYWKAKGSQGRCWGYGEHVVDNDDVCDSWTADQPDTRAATTRYERTQK